MGVNYHQFPSSRREMAGNGGVTTRLQAKKVREMLSRHGSGGKRRSSKEVWSQLDDENMSNVSTLVYSRRSFPLEHESDPRTRDRKKGVKTEMSTKQRRTLCDRDRNQSFQFERQHSQILGEENFSKQETSADHHMDCQDFDSQLHVLADEMQTTTPGLLSVDTDLLKTADFSNPRSCVPGGIIDIDKNPDSLISTVYTRDIMEYLTFLETRDTLKPGFLDNSPDVTSRMRGVLMDWLLQVQNHEELRDETLHLCICLIDRFLSLVDVKMPKLQLVGITCLLIASKFNERFAPEISTLCYLTDNTFVKDQVLQYERFILHTLHFDLACPVCSTFLDRYLQVHKHIPEVEYLARYLLDLSITNIHLATVIPSVKAAGAVYLSRRLFMDSVPVWTPDLKYYTNYGAEDLHDITNELATLLIKAPDSKFQGARSKYNNADFSYISQCDRAEPSWVLLRQFV